MSRSEKIAIVISMIGAVGVLYFIVKWTFL